MRTGARIDALGINATFEDGDLLDSAVVIMRVIDAEGRTAVRTAWSPGMDWVSRRGLIEVARDSERLPPHDEEDE